MKTPYGEPISSLIVSGIENWENENMGLKMEKMET